MKKIAMDIETLPTEDENVIAELRSAISAPASYKKPESIAEWMKENGEAALSEKVAKTSFDGLYGRIACIAWSFWEECFSVDSRHGETIMLFNFMDQLENGLSHHLKRNPELKSDAVFVGHNIAAFDLPFIKHRCILLGVKPHPALSKAFSAKAWDSCINDTMLMWSSDREKRVGLDKLCRSMGIPGKGDFDGSMVAETWKVDPEKVIEYCKDDVRRVIALHDRLTFSEDEKFKGAFGKAAA